MASSFVKQIAWCLIGTLAHAIVATAPTMANPLPHNGSSATSPQRVISLGGTVTEIVYELEQESRLVANDLSSIYPPHATTLPRVGYYRSLPLEGLLSLQPDLILASEQAGPKSVLQRIENLGITVVTVSDNGTLGSLYQRVTQIADALGVAERGKQVEQQIRRDVEQAIGTATQHHAPVRTVMLMKRTSQLQAAGSGTAAGKLLELSGLQNLLSSHQGYRTLSTESLAALQPELIITTTGSLDALGGLEAFSQSPSIRLTPAAQHHNIVAIDDLLILGLGPRTAQTIEQLTTARNQAINTR